MHRLTLPIVLFAAVSASSCGGSEPAPAQKPGAQTSGTQTPPAGTGAPSNQEAGQKTDQNVAEFTVEADDKMTFNVKELEVQAGQKVRITLHNVGSIPKVAMGHNFVVLNRGVALATFAPKVMPPAGTIENDYLPQEARKDVLAHTKLLGPGEKDTIEFTAPGVPGELVFLCTFVGHVGTMNGKILVK